MTNLKKQPQSNIDMQNNQNDSDEQYLFPARRVGAIVTAMVEAIENAINNPTPRNEAIAYTLWEKRHAVRVETQDEIKKLAGESGLRSPLEMSIVLQVAIDAWRVDNSVESKRVQNRLSWLMLGAEHKIREQDDEGGLSYESTRALIELKCALEHMKITPTRRQQLIVNTLFVRLLEFAEFAEFDAYSGRENEDANIREI